MCECSVQVSGPLLLPAEVAAAAGGTGGSASPAHEACSAGASDYCPAPHLAHFLERDPGGRGAPGGAGGRYQVGRGGRAGGREGHLLTAHRSGM